MLQSKGDTLRVGCSLQSERFDRGTTASMMGKLLVAIGVWLIGDAVLSILIWWEQSWRRDHSIRVIRGLIGIVLVVIGWRR